MTCVTEAYALVALGNACVVSLKYGNEFLDEGGALLKDCLSRGCHHFLVCHQHFFGRGWLFLLEQGIALLECLVVANQEGKISGVVLGNHHVHESTSLLTASQYQFVIVGGDKYQGQQADVFRHSLVCLLIASEHLLLVYLLSAGKNFVDSI